MYISKFKGVELNIFLNNHDKQQIYSVSEYMYEISIVVQFPVLLPFSRKGNPGNRLEKPIINSR